MIELPEHFFKYLTPLLLATTYISAFESGNPTCKRFIINYFLYLLTSFSIYITTIKIYDEKNVPINKKITIGLTLLLLLLIVGITFTKNQIHQHILYFLILVIMAYLQRVYLQKLDKEVIEDTLKKMMIIIIICVLIALKFPQYMNDSFLTILIFALIFVIFFRIIDYAFFDKKYNDMISTFSVFLFSCLIMYDTNRVIKESKNCVVQGGNPNYLDHVLDMYLNIINLFNNLSDVLE
tara:strand:- start:813 stop:1523 length:711 start_codon:yes stop_codon:yes gene_type:complete